MKKSGYRTMSHIYLIFLVSLLGAILAAIILFCVLITVRMPGGSTVRSDWPKSFADSFGNQILFVDGKPQVRQAGLERLQENGIGLQILDPSGYEQFSFLKPEYAAAVYTPMELLRLDQAGRLHNHEATPFVTAVAHNGRDYACVFYFPAPIAKVTMYLNGDKFTGGRPVILLIAGILLMAVLASGVIYGFWTTRVMARLTGSIREIAARRYVPLQAQGAFKDIYDSLNTLDAEIKDSDRLQEQTDKLRGEWISNITHDLRTPLSPIKGYAEIMQDQGCSNTEQYQRYAQIMLRNAAYMETLLDDLKLTYQLENTMIPLKLQEQNLFRFFKELIIDMLNSPDYEHRSIHFDPAGEPVLLAFDQTLMRRAFLNLIGNAFVHGDEHTEVTLRISASDAMLHIAVSDNGRGMTAEEVSFLFRRYYRGTNTEHKPEGTGLGLAIAKSIIELHGGGISVSSTPGTGTTFHVQLPTG